MTEECLVALDVDGVLNHFSKSAKNSESGKIGPWEIRYRPELLSRLKTVLSLPHVRGAWLTTWLSEPQLLDELESFLGLDGLIPIRALYPHMEDIGGGAKAVLEPRLQGCEFSPRTLKWWKYASAQALLEDHAPCRFAWLDDDLGMNTFPGHPGKAINTYEKLLLKTHETAGMLPADLSVLEQWVAMGKPENPESNLN